MDSLGSPVPGIPVTFAAPPGGPGATFEGVSAYTTPTDEGGVATANAQANAVGGSYTILATASGLGMPVSFALGNFGWYGRPTGMTADPVRAPRRPAPPSRRRLPSQDSSPVTQYVSPAARTPAQAPSW